MTSTSATTSAVPSRLPALGNPAHLLSPIILRKLVANWLAEDCPSMDYGGFVVGEGKGEARLLGKSPGILAGIPFFDEVFRQLDCTVEWHQPEGTSITPITHVATVRGSTRALLLGERVSLNALARCSGIATKSAALLAHLRAASYPNTLAGTRKTTPGFRLVEKYGILVGGCDAHRHDLSSMVMLKDNHVWAVGSITKAVMAARAAAGFSVKIEVECQSEAEAEEAVTAGADVVMLDNFKAEDIEASCQRLRERCGGQGRKEFLIEVSGGLTMENVRYYASKEVDIISTSSIHQGVPHVDFSLKIVH